ncbi:MAG: signal peptide peptidase SppA [bacterium]
MNEDHKPSEGAPSSGAAGSGQTGWTPGQGTYQGGGTPPYGHPPGWYPPPGYPYQPSGWYGPPPGKKPRRSHPALIILLFFLVAIFIGIIVAMTSGGTGKSTGLSGFSMGKRVGIVKVEGIILDSSRVVKQIHRYRDDSSVKAVVIRVDSPGGGVGASQEIHDEVKKLAEEKPVVVSMGAMAASGGYYVACPAKKIYANPGSITGSIGVVMEFTSLEGLMEWMKIENRIIKSAEYKDIGSAFRKMKDDEKKLLQEFVANVHQQFEKAVADGRDMEPALVHKIADGRIFTGEQAKEAGLVDELGNLWDAIDEAAELGGIAGKPKVVWPPKKKPPFPFGVFKDIMPDTWSTNRLGPAPLRAMYILKVH